MRSSKWLASLACAGLLWSADAAAQQHARGFELERLYTSAPGAGWFVMDALDTRGGLGGAVSLVTSYARNPLRVTDGQNRLGVVSDQGFIQLGLAATYDRFRVYVSFDSPLTVQGNSGTVGPWTFDAPSVDPGSAPDAITHGRIGADARLFGDADGPLRLGLGAQLYFPGGAPGSLRDNYLSDDPPGDTLGAYHFMARALVAGNLGHFTYAAQLGFHLRALDEPAPGAPQGHELLYGVAGGYATRVNPAFALVIGPEVFGETALRSAFSHDATGVEGLLTARLEGVRDTGPQLRLKLGPGAGLDAHFGTPEWRVVFGVELFGWVPKPPTANTQTH